MSQLRWQRLFLSDWLASSSATADLRRLTELATYFSIIYFTLLLGSFLYSYLMLCLLQTDSFSIQRLPDSFLIGCYRISVPDFLAARQISMLLMSGLLANSTRAHKEGQSCNVNGPSSSLNQMAFTGHPTNLWIGNSLITEARGQCRTDERLDGLYL